MHAYSQNASNLLKVTGKTFKDIQICISVYTKILKGTNVFKIHNYKKNVSNQNIGIISDISCDTEDWSNGC